MMSDRRSEARYKVTLPALCWGRHRPNFYAVTDDLSSDGIRFKSSVVPAVDERLTCSIRHAGSIEAIVVRTETSAFAIRVLSADHPLGLVVQSLLSHARSQNPPPLLTRAFPRIVPESQEVLVTTESGSMRQGRVINISASGVAVSMVEPLDVGTLIVIGKTRAKVARRFDNGIGAAFLSPLHEDAVGPHVVL
ncbi:PilZ domain-containing protein [Methylobacterium sp. 10]|uniref:PilZ domain-containing protein n=1 Tax=Methylobacterium sp. 10 TaxID=1101191 RepID=UPI001FDAB9C2|nr:PilZ domain-containing protein [Methylobacterium sp. 10]